jgi:YozE SAM-like fold
MKSKPNTIDYIKRLAKKIKKEKSITHTQALDFISIEHGYFNWKHYLNILSKNTNNDVKVVIDLFQITFTEWLKKHKNRNSPLGDLASDMLRDREWPSYNSLEDYNAYLHMKNASNGATEALKRAWKTYIAFLKKKNSPVSDILHIKKGSPKNYDLRKIVFEKNLISLQFKDRTIEKFSPSDKAWISWDGRKAIPVSIVKVDDRNYTIRIERPLKNEGNEHVLFLDEVRSTPKLACINHVTM